MGFADTTFRRCGRLMRVALSGHGLAALPGFDFVRYCEFDIHHSLACGMIWHGGAFALRTHAPHSLPHANLSAHHH